MGERRSTGLRLPRHFLGVLQAAHLLSVNGAEPIIEAGVYSSRGEPGARGSVFENMKQYLVVKIAKQLGSLAEMIPVAGLFPLEAAEQFVRSAVADEPGALFLIQQVGNA